MMRLLGITLLSALARAQNMTSGAGTLPPLINCESYIANTVYNWQLMECQCSERFPVIVRNPVDSVISFGCAPPGIATDIPPCMPPMYFSFYKRQCMNMTSHTQASVSVSPSLSAKPSQNAPSMSSSPLKSEDGETPSATMTAKPTQRVVQDPSPSERSDISDPSASMTVRTTQRTTPDDTQKPSESMTARPVSFTPKPTSSALPTRRPNSAWNVDATRPPLPSRHPIPSYSQRPLLQSAKPTPWRPRDPLPSGMPIPPYIQLSVKFPGANATRMQHPDVIQEIQASLACALNLALDNIRIENVTVRRVGANPIIINVGIMPALRGNLSGCFRTATAAARLLRGNGRILQTTDSSVDVDYYIVDPSADVLALSTAEFSNVLANSVPMIEIAASVGSSGVTAIATEGSGSAAAAAPAGATTTNNSNFQVGSLIGGVVGGVALCVVAFTAYKIATRDRRGTQPLRGNSIRHSRVILVDNTNPLQIGAILGTSSPHLVGYAPTQSRQRSRV